jgi:hypothetical protein
MYPAEYLNSLYTWEDLPDELYAPFENLTYSKVEPYEDSGVTVYYEAPQVAEEDQRIFIEIGDNANWNSGSLSTAGGPCLVPEGANPLIEDLFEDTYTATIEGFTFREPERTSLCTWFDGGFVLVYTTPESIDAFDVFGGYTGPLYKWVAQGRFLQPDEGGGFWIKDGPQSSPVGTYQGISGQTGGFETFTIPEP